MIVAEHIVVIGSRAQEWHLFPLGDLQFGAEGFREDLWKEVVRSVKSDPLALTIGMGDYTDLFRPTIQSRFRGATADDMSALEQLEDLHRSHIRDVAKKLSPVIAKGRCLGLLGGHHDMDYQMGGINSTQYLCNLLNVKYLGRSCLLRLRFKHVDSAVVATTTNLKIHAQHGAGNARFVSTDMGNLERNTAPYYNADVFLRGHSTKKGAIKMLEYDMDFSRPPRLMERDKLLVNTGGFMSGYPEGPRASYVERSNMAPASLGWVKVNIKLHNIDFHRRNKDSQRESRKIELSATVY